MRMAFQYQVALPCGRRFSLRNLITYEGQLALLQKIFAESGSLYVAGSARTSLYVGLCNQIPTRGMELTSITTEPVAAVGDYIRQEWEIGSLASGNSFVKRNNFAYIEGPVITFTASESAFSRAVRRFFMTTASTESTAGILLSVSGPLPQPVLVAATDTNGLSVKPSLGFFN